MAVPFDSSGQDKWENNTAASGSRTWKETVNPQSTNVLAFVSFLWIGSVDTSGATFTVKWGGQTLTLLPGSSKSWGTSNSITHQTYYIWNPPGGQQTLEVAWAGMPTGGSSRYLAVGSVAYPNVAAFDTAVQATATSSVSNTVTVPSTAPAYRVVTFHAVTGQSMNGTYTQTKRVYQSMWQTKASLLIGDAAGAASVVATATQGATTNWNAVGVNMTPTLVSGGSSTVVTVDVDASGTVYREANPAPGRTWLIEQGSLKGPIDTRIGPRGFDGKGIDEVARVGDALVFRLNGATVGTADISDFVLNPSTVDGGSL